MKDQKIHIKISDLLKEAGKKDEIDFENIEVEELPTMSKEGVSGSISLQSLSEDSLLASLKNTECVITDICDICTEKHKRKVHIDKYTAKFVEPKQKETYQDDQDEIFLIDPKNEIIDIYEMILQGIKLQEPIAKRCPSCQKHIEKEDDNMEQRDSFESKENIRIIKK